MRGIGKITKTEIGLLLLAVVFFGGMTAVHFTPHQTGESGYEVTTVGRREIAASEVEKVNLNTADAAELEALPGIGETLAQRIVAYREENGRFTAPEDLMGVEGIGEKTINGLQDYVILEVTE